MGLRSVVLLLCFTAADNAGCFRVNRCECIMKDGSGVINLNGMGDADGFLGRLTPVPAADCEVLLSFSPCRPFTQTDAVLGSDCTNVAACLVIRRQRLSTSVNFGEHEGNEFVYNDSQKVLSVSYYAHGERPLTIVHYHCDPNASATSIRQLLLTASGPLQVWVGSPCACPNACAGGDLGLGAIFLIVLSLSAAAYFILGKARVHSGRSAAAVGFRFLRNRASGVRPATSAPRGDQHEHIPHASPTAWENKPRLTSAGASCQSAED